MGFSGLGADLVSLLPQATELAKEEVKRVLGILDAHLRTRTFLVGERITLADITVVCTLLWLYKQVRVAGGGWLRGRSQQLWRGLAALEALDRGCCLDGSLGLAWSSWCPGQQKAAAVCAA